MSEVYNDCTVQTMNVNMGDNYTGNKPIEVNELTVKIPAKVELNVKDPWIE